jgi:hypothetical protein
MLRNEGLGGAAYRSGVVVSAGTSGAGAGRVTERQNQREMTGA